MLEQYLRAFINYQQSDWYEILPFAELAYNNAENSSSGYSPFFATYGLHPRIIPLEGLMPSSNRVPAVDNKIDRIHETFKEIQNNLSRSKEQQKKCFDRHRCHGHKFKIGDRVWLLSKNIKTARPCKKLDHTKIGPFKIIEKINEVTFRLELPRTMKIHDSFHISLLEPVRVNTFSTRKTTQVSPIIEDDQEVYEIEEILDSRIIKGRLQYLVHWKGYTINDRTWEPFENFTNGYNNKKLIEFHARYPSKAGSPRKDRSFKKRE